MATAKEKMTEIIQNQPDDSSYDEMLGELAFARMVERGLEDSRPGRTISNEKMGRRIATLDTRLREAAKKTEVPILMD